MGFTFRATAVGIVPLGAVYLAVAQGTLQVGLTDLAFLSGHGKGVLEGAVTDDFWSGPERDRIVGMYQEGDRANTSFPMAKSTFMRLVVREVAG